MLFPMLDLLRGWNERSFLGWRALGSRVAAVALSWVILAAVLRPSDLGEVPPLGVWLLGSLLLLGWVLLLARLTAWIGGYPWRAALAGWSRLLPITLLIPVIDALWWHLGEAGAPTWWVAPNRFIAWLFLGLNHEGAVSPGLALIVLASAGLFAYALQYRAVSRPRIVLGAILALALPWLALAFPSLTAWSRLSSYGTTLAPVTQVVSQAFERAWGYSYWSSGFERFLDLQVTSPNMEARMLFVVFAWIAVVALLSPSLWSRRPLRAGLRVGFARFPLVAAPLLGGYVMHFASVPGRTLLSSVALALALIYLVALLTVIATSPEEGLVEERSLAIPLALIGGWAFGWGALLGVLAFIGLSRLVQAAESWGVRACWQALQWAVVFCLGSWLAAGVSLFFWRPAFLLGVFGLWLAVVVACQGIERLQAGQELEWRGRLLSFRTFQGGLFGLWLVSLAVLWWGVGVWRFAWGVLVLGLLGPAVTVFFTAETRSRQVVLAVFPLLLGLLLHAGVFLP